LAQDAATKNYVDTSASKTAITIAKNSGLYGTSYRFYYRFNTNAGGFEVITQPLTILVSICD
jgi:hypothetical protein